MQYAQTPIGSLPVNLLMLSSGEVAFVVVNKFSCVIDQAEEGKVGAIFHQDKFSIGDYKDLAYNQQYTYKEMPDMLAWLIQQRLGE